jgi:pimeloyl-ACP methyl ester carboxylesterase
MGGYVAMAFAAQFPERTAGLILADTKANADGEEARANRARIAQQVLDSGSTVALAATQADVMFSASTKSTRTDVVQWLKDTIHRQQPNGVASAQHAMAGRAEQFAMLSTLHQPVLCIRGAEDALASAEDHTRMAEASGDALDITVADAGHLVPIEQPAVFVEHVSAFLARIRAPHC